MGIKKILGASIKESTLLFWMAASFWMFDNFSSIYLLNKYPEYISEANPIAAYFFSWGWPGYIANFFLCMGLIYFMIKIFPRIYAKLSLVKDRKETKKSYERKVSFYRTLFTGVMIGGEFAVIVMNFSLLGRVLP